MQPKNSFSWTIRYTLLNAAYFIAFCTVHAYAAVYLLANGFSNTEVGVLLAIANITSAVFQPLIAAVIDKQGFLTNKRFILISVLIMLAGSLVLMAVPGMKVVIFIIFALIYMIQFAYQPVMTALCFEYQKKGCGIIYGLARGLGSASFAITSVFIGRVVEESGVTVLLWVTVGAMILSVIVILTFVAPVAADASGEEDTKPKGKAHNNFISFVKTYPAFSLFLVGTVLFFFAHNMINDFMIQIIRSLGGNETELGYANFLQAILELPVMALIGLVLKKIASGKLLIISGIAFFIKILILVFASGMGHMYLSQSFQLFAYAVFIPVSAYYVSRTMEEYDQVKGQAFITSAITIGGVFSNLISGVILDNLGIRPMLITGTVVCAVGMVITIVAMTRLPHYNNMQGEQT
ncbi:MAG: MFS transporter [Clostridiales bacterium]|nr:MFS transporter [Clostridiales bacterium]